MAEEFGEFCKSHTGDEIFNYLENLYSYIKVIDREYNINDIDLEKSYINYTAIIKIKDKYYSFDWYWSFKDRVDADLIEVFPKEETIIRYIRKDGYES